VLSRPGGAPQKFHVGRGRSTSLVCRELRLIAQVLCGKLEEHPFGDLPEEIRRDWVEQLVGLERRPDDRTSAVEFRLLLAVAQAAGDPDSEYLGEMASSGIPLGTQGFPAV